MQKLDLGRLVKLAEELPNTGPRYTSYPSANHFVEDDFREAYRREWRRSTGPISIYVHVPFCRTVCYYCACNRIHTANRVHAETYHKHLCEEIRIQARTTGRRRVTQLHFGGGTPTSLSHAQMAAVFDELHRCYDLSDAADRDFSIELDPRKVTAERVGQLVELGFNRISIGVQDFDPKVQKAINRIQSEAETAAVIEAARAAGVQSVSVDLIYGLPRQSTDGLAQTLRKTLSLDPDRISLYHYAHLPQMFKTQRQIRSEELPDRDLRLALFSAAIATLTENGYRYLGMDHFAKHADPLVKALHDGSLERNFMGYSTHGHCDLLGLGISSIGQVGPLYTQNCKTLNDYYAAIDDGRLPLVKGLERTPDDELRAWVIQSLMCQLVLDKAVFEARFHTRFDDVFAAREQTRTQLAELAGRGLVEVDDERIAVTELGRFFLRNICMAFDAYLNPQQSNHSRTA